MDNFSPSILGKFAIVLYDSLPFSMRDTHVRISCFAVMASCIHNVSVFADVIRNICFPGAKNGEGEEAQLAGTLRRLPMKNDLVVKRLLPSYFASTTSASRLSAPIRYRHGNIFHCALVTSSPLFLIRDFRCGRVCTCVIELCFSVLFAVTHRG